MRTQKLPSWRCKAGETLSRMFNFFPSLYIQGYAPWLTVKNNRYFAAAKKKLNEEPRKDKLANGKFFNEMRVKKFKQNSGCVCAKYPANQMLQDIKIFFFRRVLKLSRVQSIFFIQIFAAKKLYFNAFYSFG